MGRCAPGRGTTAAYRPTAVAYYRAVAAAQQQIAIAQAAAFARQKDLLGQATTVGGRLAAASAAYQEGDVRVASRIYVSLALSSRDPAVAAEARRRLAQLAEEARRKLNAVDARLTEKGSMWSPGESSDPLTPQQLAARRQKLVFEAFQEYDQLARDYGDVPAAKGELNQRIRKQRGRPELAAVLNEPEAKILWEEGQQHEREDHLCCAYWVYKKAATLAPAPSAARARRRFAEMAKDPKIVASAKVCRELQECHRVYNRAEKLKKADGEKAKELFAQIVDRAPADSEVYRAALAHLQEMK